MSDYDDFIKCIKGGHAKALDYLSKENGRYEFPAVVAGVAVYDNYAFRHAALNGPLAIVDRLLQKSADGIYEFPDVVGDIAARSNYALRRAACNAHLAIVDRLLGKHMSFQLL